MDVLETARTQLHGGDIHAARRTATQYAERHPTNDDAQVMLGIIHSQLGEHGRAYKHFSLAAQLRKTEGGQRHIGARVNRAISALNAGQGEDAATELLELEQLTRNTPQHDAVLNNLAWALLLNEDYHLAAAYAAQVSDQQPDVKRHALLNEAEAYLGQGHPQQATECLDRLQIPLSREEQGRSALLRAKAERRSNLKINLLRSILEIQGLSVTTTAEAHLELARLERDVNTCLEHAIKAARGLSNDHRRAVEALKLQASLHEQLGQYQAALNAERQAGEAQQTLTKEQHENRLEILRVNHELNAAQLRIEEAQLARATAEQAVQEHLQSLKHLASTDVLTGLHNRSSFEQIAMKLLDAGESFSLCLMDLDRFKYLNDAFGHEHGDQLLKEISHVLSSELNAEEHIARWGGDEFLILIPGDSQHGLSRAQDIRNSLRRCNSVHKLSGSFGLAHTTTSRTLSDLRRYADKAMYTAKRQQLGVASYAPTPGELSDLDLQSLLTESTFASEEFKLGVGFHLEHQAILNLNTEQVIAAESLLRYTAPNGQIISPVRFIPLLEENGSIQRVGHQVTLQAWRELQPLQLRASVNASTQQLQRNALEHTIEEGIRYGLDPELLQIEVTESSVMRDVTQANAILAQLSSRGVRLAIDDFGTGHSSLAAIRDLNVHTLKIDRSFTRRITESRRDAGITQIIANLAQTLDLRTVIEGIESIEQARIATQIGIDTAQGWLYHKAQPIDTFGAWLQARH